MPSNQIHIHRLHELHEIQEISKLEKTVWKMDPIPIHQTYTAAKNGGILLGAYDSGELIGFQYSFSGFRKGQAYLCSHMLGIHPDYRKRGIGELLKQKQREVAIEMGYSLITWTFDPLESVNASLNLSKLRGICASYLVNHYGTMTDVFNRGLETDRFLVEWWINSSYVREPAQRTVLREDLSLLTVELNERELPFIVHHETGHAIDSTQEVWFVPIPDQFQVLKQKDIKLAIDWREKTRTIFEQLLSHGYAATNLLYKKEQKVCFYVFQKRESLAVPDPLEGE